MIELKDIKKSFASNQVLKGIDLKVPTGKVVSIIGPSGSGKSTLLRTINCLEPADSGIIELDGTKIDTTTITNKEKMFLRKNTAMVFQGFYLFNNKSVLENITEGLIVVQKKTKKEADIIAESILEKIGLKDKRDARPHELSGGQQQRVAIGRAIALEPKLLLLDEPTSALDPELINEVLILIKDLAMQDQTMLIVTHEIMFAKNISDEIYFMDKGKIVEKGEAKELIENPKEQRIIDFLKNVTKKID